MKLKIVGSGSSGNCYVLTCSSGKSLIIEAGINFKEVKKALDFNLSNVQGVLVSHSHGDHAKAANDMLSAGLNVYMTEETKKEVGCTHHRVNIMKSRETFTVDSWKVLPFDVKHDVKCVGFLLNHSECGNVLFLTDSMYSPYRFNGLNNVIIEANYSKAIIDKKYGPESGKEFLRNRILRSHFSLENCMDMLSVNDLSAVNNIVVIHLSDTNSDEAMFKREISELTGKTVTIASNGLVIDFDKTPF